MTVSSTTNKVVFVGDDASTIFPFTFRIFEDTDLVVTLYTIADGTEETLHLTSDYTVTINGTSGGTVTKNSALLNEYKLIIQRVLPLTQEADYVANDPFPAETHEAVADRAVMLCQQIKEVADRALRNNPTQTGVDSTLPLPEANSVLGWNSTADAIVNYTQNASAYLTKASQAEAEAGTDNANFMTPLRTAQAIASKSNSTGGFNFVIYGGGSAISTGVAGFITIPFAVTITKVRAVADTSGSIVIDLWNDVYANFPPTDADSITASAPITITSDTDVEDSTLTGWDTTLASGSVLAFNVDSCATIGQVTITVFYTRS